MKGAYEGEQACASFVIGHNFHPFSFVHFDPTLSLSLLTFLLMFIFLMSLFPFYAFNPTHDNTAKTQFNWYGTGLPTPNVDYWTTTQST